MRDLVLRLGVLPSEAAGVVARAAGLLRPRVVIGSDAEAVRVRDAQHQALGRIAAHLAEHNDPAAAAALADGLAARNPQIRSSHPVLPGGAPQRRTRTRTRSASNPAPDPAPVPGRTTRNSRTSAVGQAPPSRAALPQDDDLFGGDVSDHAGTDSDSGGSLFGGDVSDHAGTDSDSGGSLFGGDVSDHDTPGPEERGGREGIAAAGASSRAHVSAGYGLALPRSSGFRGPAGHHNRPGGRPPHDTGRRVEDQGGGTGGLPAGHVDHDAGGLARQDMPDHGQSGHGQAGAGEDIASSAAFQDAVRAHTQEGTPILGDHAKVPWGNPAHKPPLNWLAPRHEGPRLSDQDRQHLFTALAEITDPPELGAVHRYITSAYSTALTADALLRLNDAFITGRDTHIVELIAETAGKTEEMLHEALKRYRDTGTLHTPENHDPTPLDQWLKANNPKGPEREAALAALTAMHRTPHTPQQQKRQVYPAEVLKQAIEQQSEMPEKNRWAQTAKQTVGTAEVPIGQSLHNLLQRAKRSAGGVYHDLGVFRPFGLVAFCWSDWPIPVRR